MPEPAAGVRTPWIRLLDVVRCPLCGQRLAPEGRTLRCPQRHTFDTAKQGYVGLLGGGKRAAPADSADMVRARADFLDAGHYAPLATALADAARELCPARGTVLDAGAGTGHYLAAVLDAVPEAVGLGLDASVYALRRAARAHDRAGAASWDVWQPFPLRDAAVDLVLNVFAPRNGAEFRRVLRPSGALLVVTPTVRHLAELRGELGLLEIDPAKEERLQRTLEDRFVPESSTQLEYAMRLSAQDIENLALMGPAAHHLDAGELRERVAALGEPRAVTASFTLSVHRPAGRTARAGDS